MPTQTFPKTDHRFSELSRLSETEVTLQSEFGSIHEGKIVLYWNNKGQKVITKTFIMFEGEWMSLEDFIGGEDIKVEIYLPKE